VSLLERIKRLWSASPEPDHPLNEEERTELPPEDQHDELAQTAAKAYRTGNPGQGG
jgi:hypothetical protein